MKINVSFEDKKQLKASFDNHTVLSDQPVSNGGDGLAPDPFEYFLTSTALCAAHYIRSFCEARNISAQGIKLSQNAIQDQNDKYSKTIELLIELPEDFPQKYRKALISSAEGCTVKKVIEKKPKFIVTIQD